MEDVDLLQVQRSIPHRTEDLQLIPRPQLFYDIAEVLGGLEGCALNPAPPIQPHSLIMKGQEYVSTSDHPGRPGDKTVQPVALAVLCPGYLAFEDMGICALVGLIEHIPLHRLRSYGLKCSFNGHWIRASYAEEDWISRMGREYHSMVMMVHSIPGLGISEPVRFPYGGGIYEPGRAPAAALPIGYQLIGPVRQVCPHRCQSADQTPSLLEAPIPYPLLVQKSSRGVYAENLRDRRAIEGPHPLRHLLCNHQSGIGVGTREVGKLEKRLESDSLHHIRAAALKAEGEGSIAPGLIAGAGIEADEPGQALDLPPRNEPLHEHRGQISGAQASFRIGIIYSNKHGQA